MNRTNEKAAGVLDTLATAQEITHLDSTPAHGVPSHPLALAYTAINHAMLRCWCASPSRWLRGTIRPKPKGPAHKNAFGQAVATSQHKPLIPCVPACVPPQCVPPWR